MIEQDDVETAEQEAVLEAPVESNARLIAAMDALTRAAEEALIEQETLLTAPTARTLPQFAAWVAEHGRAAVQRIQNVFAGCRSGGYTPEGDFVVDPVQPVSPVFDVREAGEQLVVIAFGGPSVRCQGYGQIRVVRRADDRLQMYVSGPKADWPNLSKVWVALQDKLAEAGWLGSDGAALGVQEQAILDRWNERYTAGEIGDELGLSVGRVRNILTDLRKRVGADRVPYHRK